MSTVVFLHAHPDDEAMLTAGTMAGLAAAGHRVVLVCATDGEGGLASAVVADGDLGGVRRDELARAAATLGVARTVRLGYPDSGMADAPTTAPGAFARVAPEGPAEALARLLTAEGADVLVHYDPAGGYGHPDHRRVHDVGVLAARLAGTPRVLEATVDRRALRRALWLLAPVARWAPEVRRSRFAAAFSGPDEITHRVDVRPQLGAKRAAMAAHASQATADGQGRTLRWFLRLPSPLYAATFGREWYVERARPSGHVAADIIAPHS